MPTPFERLFRVYQAIAEFEETEGISALENLRTVFAEEQAGAHADVIIRNIMEKPNESLPPQP